MSKLFKLTFILALMFGTFNFATTKANDLPYMQDNIPNFKYGCKTFHIKVSIKFVEIETDVTVCAGCTSYMAVNCGGSISKNANGQDLSFGGMNLNDLLKDERFSDAEEIIVLGSSTEKDEETALTIKTGTYKIIKDQDGYGAIVNLEKTN
ncbi:hypothetical protein [Chryseobacterium daeguense]|uniref:hypothetical protein n=1 Tax=Chryseobacterium daeguense TaxID=412438 RepID=UPI0004293DB3|nr:hypothetical protein [Chryseobacterium daeguense]